MPICFLGWGALKSVKTVIFKAAQENRKLSFAVLISLSRRQLCPYVTYFDDPTVCLHLYYDWFLIWRVQWESEFFDFRQFWETAERRYLDDNNNPEQSFRQKAHRAIAEYFEGKWAYGKPFKGTNGLQVNSSNSVSRNNRQRHWFH